MTEADKKDVAKYLAEELKGHKCQFSEEDRATLREFAQSLRTTKATALSVFVGAVVVFVLGAFGVGLIMKLKP